MGLNYKVQLALVAILPFFQIKSLAANDKTSYLPQTEGCICPEIYEPICASNGRNYSNSCFLNCDRKRDPELLGLCEGECPCCKKPYYNEPLIIEQNGWGWGGWGWKLDESLWNPAKVNQSGKDAGVPGCICTADLRPVCGSDGVTYSNHCALECERKYKNPCLTQVCEGKCPCKCE